MSIGRTQVGVCQISFFLVLSFPFLGTNLALLPFLRNQPNVLENRAYPSEALPKTSRGCNCGYTVIGRVVFGVGKNVCLVYAQDSFRLFWALTNL